MRSFLPVLASLFVLLPPVKRVVLEGLRPLYRPADDFRAYLTLYRWCTFQEETAPPPEVPQGESLPPGRLRLRGAFPGDYPQELVLEGIPRGEILVDDRGVFVGRITQSTGRFHNARTLYAPGLCVSVRVGEETRWGLMCGGRPPELLWIPLYATLAPGETLRTSGMGGIPEGLLVGTVTHVETSRIEPGFFRGQVQPFARYHTTLFFWSLAHEGTAVESDLPGRVLP